MSLSKYDGITSDKICSNDRLSHSRQYPEGFADYELSCFTIPAGTDLTIFSLSKIARIYYRTLLILFLCLTALFLPSAAWSSVSVEIRGLDDEILQNVRSQVTLARRAGEDLGATNVRRLHRRAPDEIRTALKPLGYYHTRIEERLSRNGDNWTAEYDVEPGPPIRLTKLQLNLVGPGREDPLLRRAIREFPLNTGDVLHQGRYTEGKTQFFRMARLNGYLDGEFDTSIVEINRETNAASVHLQFRTGRRYRFGKISIHDDTLNDTFLRKLVILRSGDPFSRDELNRQERVFESTEYFRNVRVEPEIDSPDGDQIPLNVRLTPAPKRTYSVGAGYGTNTGPRLRLNYQNRRVNRRGHRFRVESLLSPRLVELDSTYMIPIGNPNRSRFELNATVSREDYPHSLSTLAAVGPVHVRNRDNWTERKSIKIRQENFRVNGQDGHSTLLVPTWNLQKIRLDRASLPRRGFSVTGQLRGSAKVLGSEASFLQFSGETRYVRQLLPVGLRLHLRSSLGSTAVRDITELPPTLRFFTGGDDSVRGYSYYDLGARRDGEVIGGKHLTVGSIELEQDIVGNWSTALFFDAGNSFNTFDEIRNQYKRSSGVGIRWRSPIGPFHLDYAQALDEPDNPGRIHFSIGPRL